MLSQEAIGGCAQQNEGEKEEEGQGQGQDLENGASSRRKRHRNLQDRGEDHPNLKAVQQAGEQYNQTRGREKALREDFLR